MIHRTAVVAALALASVSASALAIPFSDPRADRNPALDAAGATEQRDPACRDARLVSAGAPAPRNPHTLAVRWVGFSNYELVYNGHVILLDAYIDRGSFFPPLGVKAADSGRDQSRLVGFNQTLDLNCVLLVDRLLGLRSEEELTSEAAEAATTRPAFAGARYRDGSGRSWQELNLGELASNETFLKIVG